MEELVTCEGTVHSIIFQNAENGYTVLRLLTEEGEVITVVGCIPCVAPGEHLAVSGVPETHPQHGEQLRAVELERSLPEDEEEIFSYLSSGICKGVGPATARRIVERFGAETLDVLEREPELLRTLAPFELHCLYYGVRSGMVSERNALTAARLSGAVRGFGRLWPSTSCLLSWLWSCGGSTATRRWRRCGRIPTSSPARRAGWSSPSPTGSPWAWGWLRTATSGSRRR